MSKKGKWLLMGGLGASLLCLGVCGSIESAFLKHSGTPTLQWVLLGTLSLFLLVLGSVLLIKAGLLEKEITTAK
ncbi:MAG: hypothetical protein AAF575_05150 [Bacteroidota bacterium]